MVIAVLLAVGAVAQAQQPKKVPHMGYLSTSEPGADTGRFNANRLCLRDLTYIEGQNITIEYRYAGEKRDRFHELAAELVWCNADIIVGTGGEGPVRAAKNPSKRIPIVTMGDEGDPVEAGFVESLARRAHLFQHP